MQRTRKFVKKNIFVLLLIFIAIVYLLINLKINFFKYNHFDFGKFDLGNMTQMVWNASRGNGLTLTDYFGTNLPRWAMSHVDPILFIFVPIFLIFPSPMTLVVSQLVLVIFSSIIVYLIAKLTLKSDIAAFLMGLVYLFNPSIGYLTAWTGFHGVTAVIPFFLGAFYVYEKMYQENKFTKKGYLIFWLLLVLTMMGKEQLPAYIFFYGVFIFLLRNPSDSIKEMFKTAAAKTSYLMMAVGIIWFCVAFFVVIPAYASYRVEGYAKFAESIDITGENNTDVALPNYFLNRYDEFGESYSEVIKNIILNPRKSVQIFFGGDKLENFIRTVAPFGYLPFAAPFVFMISTVDYFINYLTTSDGVGTSEILNHRVSMIIPVMMLATIMGISYLAGMFEKTKKLKKNTVVTLLCLVVVGFSIYTSHVYNNPIYLWGSDAVKKNIIAKVFAKTDESLINQNMNVGDVIKLNELEDKDRECAAKIVKYIPDSVSISGPDSLGAHLSMRETYAIFPALYNEADYVIVDIFSRKLLTIVDTDVEVVKDVVAELIKSDKYNLDLGCGNYFVFKKTESAKKDVLLPIQERFSYEAKYELPFFQGVEIADFEFPSKLAHGERGELKVVFYRTGDGTDKTTSLEQYIIFTSFVNQKTGEIYQQANLPFFAIKQPEDWDQERYYIEKYELVIPDFLESGDYFVMIGMGNKIRTRSIYLGDIKVD